jgi:hypothetical protein
VLGLPGPATASLPVVLAQPCINPPLEPLPPSRPSPQTIDLRRAFTPPDGTPAAAARARGSVSPSIEREPRSGRDASPPAPDALAAHPAVALLRQGSISPVDPSGPPSSRLPTPPSSLFAQPEALFADEQPAAANPPPPVSAQRQPADGAPAHAPLPARSQRLYTQPAMRTVELAAASAAPAAGPHALPERGARAAFPQARVIPTRAVDKGGRMPWAREAAPGPLPGPLPTKSPEAPDLLLPGRRPRPTVAPTKASPPTLVPVQPPPQPLARALRPARGAGR